LQLEMEGKGTLMECCWKNLLLASWVIMLFLPRFQSSLYVRRTMDKVCDPFLEISFQPPVQ
jgi:hypothetical protein